MNGVEWVIVALSIVIIVIGGVFLAMVPMHSNHNAPVNKPTHTTTSTTTTTNSTTTTKTTQAVWGG